MKTNLFYPIYINNNYLSYFININQEEQYFEELILDKVEEKNFKF